MLKKKFRAIYGLCQISSYCIENLHHDIGRTENSREIFLLFLLLPHPGSEKKTVLVLNLKLRFFLREDMH